MHIGCLFGTFDPPHLGHVAIANRVKDVAGMDRIWFVVTPQNPFKQNKRITVDEHRLAMVRLAVADEVEVEACDFELALPRPSYTARTLEAMRSRWPEHRFSLIMGSDNLAGLHRWTDPELILAHHEVWVYPRPGHEDHLEEALLRDHPAVHLLPGAPLLDLSATQVRRNIRTQGHAGELIAPSVRDYIQQKGLYAG